MPFENIDLTKTSEPEVIKAVIEEIKSFGDNIKKNHDSLKTNYEELKKTVDEQANNPDTLIEEKFQKLSNDITVRQEALDDKTAKEKKEIDDRIDQIETVLKRSPRGGDSENEIELIEEAKNFAMTSLAVKRKGEGVSFQDTEKLESDVEQYKQFCKSFEMFIRKYGGSREQIMDEPERKALQVGIDPDGGVTVPVAMSNRVTMRIFEDDPIRQLASVESITTGSMEWMAEWDEAGAGWEGESYTERQQGAETSTPGWKKRKIPVHTQYALVYATQTLLEDSGINIESWLGNKISEKLGRAENAAFVTGNGIGKPRGFLTHTNGTDWGQVEQVAMGADAVLTADGFIDVKYALKDMFHSRPLTWLMNRTTVAAAMKLKNGNGDYIWKPSQIANDPTSSILNIPVRMSTTMPEVAANALSVALADWREAYLIVDRLGITVQRDPYTAVPFIKFYTRKRLGGDVNSWEALKIGKIST